MNRSNPQVARGIIKVALVVPTISHYRVPIYRKLHEKPDLCLRVFYGDDIKDTKFVNAKNTHGFERHHLFTLQMKIRTSGRSSYITFYPGLPIALARYQPDVIITAGGGNIGNNLLVALYASVFRTPVICWSLGMLKGRQYTGLARFYRKSVVWFERYCDALLGYSTRAIRYFESVGHPQEKCFLAVNCLDTDKIFADIERVRPQIEPLRHRLGLEGKTIVLFVGAFERTKRLDRLLRAFAAARREDNSLHLLLVGDGKCRADIEKQAANLGINQHVTFTGKVIDGVTAYFQLASVFVLPGLGGLAMIEAMAHGVPVICGTCDGTEDDYVVNGENGFRFDDEQSEDEIVREIARHILTIVSDKDKQLAMSNAARDRIRFKYNGKTYVEGIYKAICYAFEHGRGARRRRSAAYKKVK